MSCEHCDDTGSLSKDIDGFLTCPHCQAAKQRTDLEAWYKTVKREQHDLMDLLWLGIQRDRKINQGEKN